MQFVSFWLPLQKEIPRSLIWVYRKQKTDKSLTEEPILFKTHKKNHSQNSSLTYNCTKTQTPNANSLKISSQIAQWTSYEPSISNPTKQTNLSPKVQFLSKPTKQLLPKLPFLRPLSASSHHFAYFQTSAQNLNAKIRGCESKSLQPIPVSF